jgi:PAS domain S-box-containing protein
MTERREAEARLRLSENLLRMAGQFAKLGGWTVDLPEGRLTWSDEVCAIHDIEPGTAPRMEDAMRFYPKEWRGLAMREVGACISEGKPFRFEAELVTAKGRRIWVNSTGVAERNDRGEIARIQGAMQDITEQKLAELEVERLALRMTTTMESITDGFFSLDREFRFTYVNHQAERVLKRPREELIGKVLWDEFPESIGTKFERHYRQAMSEGVRTEFEDLYTPLGRLFEVRAFPSEEGLAVYFRDITERRSAEEVLLEASARFRGFMDYSPLHISEIDLEGRYVQCNRAVADLYGLEPGLLIGSRYQDLVPPESVAIYSREIAMLLEEGKPRVVEDRSNVDGRERIFVTTLFPLYDAQSRITSIGGIGEEITEQRRAREAFRENETLRLIASRVARLGGWRVDLPSGTVISSDEMCALLEVPPGTVTTLPVAAQTYAPEFRETIDEAFARAMEDGAPIDVEAQLITAKGRRIWVRTLGHAIRDDQGRIVRLQGATQDITETKRRQAELEKLEGQFRQAQKMEAVGRLAGGVAHDFNNMLTVIQGYSQMLLDDLNVSDPNHASVGEILEAARRSEDLTRQLLAFARQQTIAPRVLDLSDTISSMLKMLGRLIGEDVELRWRPGENVGCVRMDPVQVDQILANLTINARDAISGTGTLTIATADVELDEEACEAQPELSPGRYAVLSVSDTGSGMEPAVLKKIFEPFFTTKAPGKGTGLGLSTVYGILKQNGGHITAYSEPGHGTSFHVYIPRDESGETSDGETPEAEPLAAGTERVLLVEDEPALLGLTRRLIEELGYSVMAWGCPEQALKELEEMGEEFDLLVTDVVMPRLSGRDLWEKLQQRRPGMKVLFMSGYTADVIAHHGVLHEGLVFLQKPFSKQSLALKLREALKKGLVPVPEA